MKKILSILLISSFLGQNLVFAQDINQPVPVCVKINNSINGFVKPEDHEYSFAQNIEINKEPIKLESYLKKRYSGYLYTLTNLANVPIEIVTVNIGANYVMTFKTDRQNERFPYVFEPHANIAFGIICLPILLPFLPLIYAISEPSNEKIDIKQEIKQDVNTYFILPVKATTLMPYYWIKDPIDDKKAAKEISKFCEGATNIIINPKEKVQFTILVDTDVYKYNFEEKAFIFIKDTSTGKIYKIVK